MSSPAYGLVEKTRKDQVFTRALTNTVGGEYECIHNYRVTNTNIQMRIFEYYLHRGNPWCSDYMSVSREP